MRSILILSCFAMALTHFDDASADPPAPRFPAAVVSAPGPSVTQSFGPTGEARADGTYERFHVGVDLGAPAGTPVSAPAQGRVMRVAEAIDGYAGQVVEIDHGDGVKTRFSGLAGTPLQPGESLAAGDIIGAVAPAAKPAVHVELWRADKAWDPAHELTLIGGRQDR